jgi:peptidoglycan/LPS O-acetylase OafA/YrhL
VLIATAYREGVRLPRAAAIGLISAGALGFLASGLWLGYANSRVIEFGVPATAMVAGAVLSNELPSLGRLERPLAFLGDASYALYLTQFLAFVMLRDWIDQATSNTAPWRYALLFLVVPIFVAIFVHVLFERPITRWLRRIFDFDRAAKPRLTQRAVLSSEPVRG